MDEDEHLALVLGPHDPETEPLDIYEARRESARKRLRTHGAKVLVAKPGGQHP